MLNKKMLQKKSEELVCAYLCGIDQTCIFLNLKVRLEMNLKKSLSSDRKTNKSLFIHNRRKETVLYRMQYCGYFT